MEPLHKALADSAFYKSEHFTNIHFLLNVNAAFKVTLAIIIK